MKQGSKKIKVLIADDHGIVRAGLASILGFEDDIAVVGEANNGLHAVEQCKALRPDVIIMDLMMPQLNGVEATVRITREMPETKVMILTTYGSADDIGRALEAGAAGTMIKTVSNDTLVSAIRQIAAGGSCIAPEIRRMLMSEPPTPDLTERQREILAAAMRGLTNEDIARQFNITSSGVKQCLSKIYQKLNVANRAEAIAYALNKKIVLHSS
jgi:NarL family two-component system response regulator LiaR